MLEKILTDGTETGLTLAIKINAVIDQLNAGQLAAAYGIVDADGTLSESFNVDSVSFDGTAFYTITINDENIDLTKSKIIATGLYNQNSTGYLTYIQNKAAGDLTENTAKIGTTDQDNNNSPSAFYFIIYK